MSKRVLITGGTGFVGANLARKMLADGHQVCLLLRQESKTWRLDDVLSELEVIRLNFLNYDETLKAVSKFKPDWLFHLAVCGAYSWQTDWKEIVDTNLASSINLLESAAKNGFECFVNTGSSSEYGFTDHAPQESEAVEPNSYYAITKAAATMACRFIASRDKLLIPTLRLYSVYGPYEDPRRLMPTLIREGLKGNLPPLVAPDTARDFVYVDDVVNAYLKATELSVEEAGSIYNIGSGTQTTIREIVEVARKELDIEEKPSWGSMDNRNWDSSVWVANIEKAKQELNWQPQSSLEDGFHKFSDWIRNSSELKLEERYKEPTPVR